LFFKKTDVEVGKEEGLTHKVTQHERHRGKTLKKQFYWKEGWCSVFKDKENYSALCKASRSVGAGKTLKKTIMESLLAKGGAGALLSRTRRIIVLCVRLSRSVGALLTQGQGR
jgi:hypothetical protein